jgi:hypothetical protein
MHMPYRINAKTINRRPARGPAGKQKKTGRALRAAGRNRKLLATMAGSTC